jgi:hypothetical protein
MVAGRGCEPWAYGTACLPACPTAASSDWGAQPSAPQATPPQTVWKAPKQHTTVWLAVVAAGSAWVEWWRSSWRQTTTMLRALWCRVSSSGSAGQAVLDSSSSRRPAAEEQRQPSAPWQAWRLQQPTWCPCPALQLPTPIPPAVASTYGGSQAPQPTGGIAAAVGTLQDQQEQGAVDLGLLFPNGVNDTGDPQNSSTPCTGSCLPAACTTAACLDADFLCGTAADSLTVLQGTATPSGTT